MSCRRRRSPARSRALLHPPPARMPCRRLRRAAISGRVVSSSIPPQQFSDFGDRLLTVDFPLPAPELAPVSIVNDRDRDLAVEPQRVGERVAVAAVVDIAIANLPLIQ